MFVYSVEFVNFLVLSMCLIRISVVCLICVFCILLMMLVSVFVMCVLLG